MAEFTQAGKLKNVRQVNRTFIGGRIAIHHATPLSGGNAQMQRHVKLTGKCLPGLDQIKFVISGINQGVAVGYAILIKKDLADMMLLHQYLCQLVRQKRALTTVNRLFHHQHIIHDLFILILFNLTNI
ncbi:hypothetical protein CF65_01520 [Aggregatibacter actinomycetemcomitans HK1651]|nr:hypothetical protein CF65_01520 [Aggregatibacter actinomycetemcomitans HK1651]